MEKLPVIGIPAESQLFSGAYRNNVNEPEVNGVVDYGGTPLLIPTRHPETMANYLPLIDGLLLPGGPDVSPLLYHEEPIPGLGDTDILLDRSEVALVKGAVAAHIPIFGLCRGLQVINVALGGTLYQDLNSQKPDGLLQHYQKAAMNQGTHHVDLTPETALQQLFGTSELLVNSHHHEAVKELAPGLKLASLASDGVVEGAESANNGSILAVQWHPETMYQTDKQMGKLFSNLIERATHYQLTRQNG